MARPPSHKRCGHFPELSHIGQVSDDSQKNPSREGEGTAVATGYAGGPGPVDQDDFTKLKNEWKKITAPLEKAREKPLRFLRYFLMANFKITNKDAIVREDEIYDWFVNKDNAKLCEYKEKPFEFVRKIIRSV